MQERVYRDDKRCEEDLRHMAQVSKVHPEYLMQRWHTTEWAMEEIDSLRVEIARLTDTRASVMVDEWRDVADLPQIGADGRSNDVLGCWPDGDMMVMYYSVCGGWSDSEGGATCVTRPAHWQPLPNPPAAEAIRPSIMCDSCQQMRFTTCPNSEQHGMATFCATFTKDEVLV